MRSQPLRVLATLIMLCPTLAVAQAPAAAPPAETMAFPEGVTAGPSVEGISEYRLANGLKVLLFPDRSKQTITVNVTYLVGSRHEGYGETGMAHLLEHLLFKGTPDHPNIPQELTERGARPNGSTWYDRTNYFETFAASDDNLEWALDLEADRMVNSFIAQQDLDSEMTVVRNEFEMGENSPQFVLMERMLSAAYLWHNYGNTTIGARSDIENVPIERLQAFYRRWYQPDNAILVVAGNFDRARSLELIQRELGAIPRPERQLPRLYTQEPAQDGERTVTLRRVGEVQLLGAAYHIPAGSHPDFAPLDLLAFVLADTPAGRLHKALVETGKAAGVGGFAFQLADPGVLLLFAEARKDRPLAEIEETLLAEVEQRILAEPPTAEEVDRARASRLTSWQTTLRDSERAAIELSEWASMGDWRLMFLHRDRVEQVTTEDVLRVAQAYLRPNNRTLGRFLPTEAAQRVAIPETPDVAALVEGYEGREVLAEGEAFDPSPEAIEARTRRLQLPGGIKVALVPRESRGDVVQLVLALHFGDLESLWGKSRIGELTGGMLMRGTESRSRQQIQDELDRLGAQLAVFGGASGAQARLEVPRPNLEAALRLLADVLRRPAFPESELEQLREAALAQLEEGKTDPFRIAFTAFRRHLEQWPEGDPRHVPTPEEAIAATEAVTGDQIRQFHRDFYGASASEVAVVGDFDAAEVEALLRELFDGWEGATPYQRIPDPYTQVAPIVQAFETPDKESAVFVAGMPLELQDTDPDYLALVLANYMTGGGFLNSRLATRLRQQEGLSYTAASSFSASPWEKDATFMSYAIYAPQNAARLEAAFSEEMQRIVEGGFTAEEVEAAKKGWLQRRQVSRSQEDELAALLQAQLHRGRTLQRDAEIDARVAALTPQEVHAAVRRHLDLERLSVIKAGDFAAGAAAGGPQAGEAAGEPDAGAGAERPPGEAGAAPVVDAPQLASPSADAGALVGRWMCQQPGAAPETSFVFSGDGALEWNVGEERFALRWQAEAEAGALALDLTGFDRGPLQGLALYCRAEIGGEDVMRLDCEPGTPAQAAERPAALGPGAWGCLRTGG
ncbi:MAG TPA: pitrilysin family protein [Thermoanaerobaculia bacterium]|nr:pitrilysin family protein [Thermoanaerobaculia bacterium]